MDKKNILGVITARGGSKGIPRKNIKLLGGKPLIAYTVQVAKDSKLITHLIVSTDDQEIADVCKKYGADVPFLRPAELATDTSKHLEVMQHAIGFMEKKLGTTFDAAVILQPTSPFRIPEDIDGTIAKLFKHPESDSAVSITEVDEPHPTKIKKLEGDKVIPYSVPEKEGARRQELEKAYKRSGAVYVVRRDVMMEKNRLLGDNVVGLVIPQERSADINNEFDWFRCEYMLEKLKEKNDPHYAKYLT